MHCGAMEDPITCQIQRLPKPEQEQQHVAVFASGGWVFFVASLPDQPGSLITAYGDKGQNVAFSLPATSTMARGGRRSEEDKEFARCRVEGGRRCNVNQILVTDGFLVVLGTFADGPEVEKKVPLFVRIATEHVRKQHVWVFSLPTLELASLEATNWGDEESLVSFYVLDAGGRRVAARATSWAVHEDDIRERQELREIVVQMMSDRGTFETTRISVEGEGIQVGTICLCGANRDWLLYEQIKVSENKALTAFPKLAIDIEKQTLITLHYPPAGAFMPARLARHPSGAALAGDAVVRIHKSGSSFKVEIMDLRTEERPTTIECPMASCKEAIYDFLRVSAIHPIEEGCHTIFAMSVIPENGEPSGPVEMVMTVNTMAKEVTITELNASPQALADPLLHCSTIQSRLLTPSTLLLAKNYGPMNKQVVICRIDTNFSRKTYPIRAFGLTSSTERLELYLEEDSFGSDSKFSFAIVERNEEEIIMNIHKVVIIDA